MHGHHPTEPTYDDEDDVASPESAWLLFVAIGVAMSLGLLCGVAWTAYHLLGWQFLG